MDKPALSHPVRRLARRAVVLAMLGWLSAAPALAAGEAFNVDGIAIRGYDPVAYFNKGEPTRGSKAYTYFWQGATWQFLNARNRDAFSRSPERYAPQYGGYCAYAASKNALAPTDPHAFTVHQGKLYLNFSPEVRETWREDVPGNVRKADGYWPSLRRRL